MANLPESSSFDAGVYQIETTDPVVGGPSGVTNAPLKNLANRTKYLKDHVDALEATRAPLSSPAFTDNPSAPTQPATDNSTKLANTAWVRNAIANIATAAGFSFSFLTTGYIKLPSWLGGFIVQWGPVLVPAGTGYGFTYPIAFPNAALAGTIAKTGSLDSEILSVFPGKTGAGVDNWPGAVETQGVLIVIGY